MDNVIQQFLATTLLLLSLATYASPNKPETAIFAGGCFWSMQHDFSSLPGIVSTTVGYTGGTVKNPTYQQVSSGTTGHYEAIKIIFDPNKISYAKLLDYYWHDTDPTNEDGQFCDTGTEYRPVIFYLDESQKKIASESKELLLKSNRFNHIATQIKPATAFYRAEDYHQHYSDKNPDNYNQYRQGCRRDSTRNAIWGN